MLACVWGGDTGTVGTLYTVKSMSNLDYCTNPLFAIALYIQSTTVKLQKDTTNFLKQPVINYIRRIFSLLAFVKTMNTRVVVYNYIDID